MSGQDLDRLIREENLKADHRDANEDELMEKILNIGIIFQQAIINHGIQCLSPLWNAKQIKAKAEIRKLLQSRQPEKPIFSGYTFGLFCSKEVSDSELMLEMEKRGLVEVVER